MSGMGLNDYDEAKEWIANILVVVALVIIVGAFSLIMFGTPANQEDGPLEKLPCACSTKEI